MIYPFQIVLTVSALLLAPVFAEEQEALKFVLPKAYYGGTVISYWSAHLETTLYPERKPLLAPKGTSVVSTGKPVTDAVSVSSVVRQVSEPVPSDAVR